MKQEEKARGGSPEDLQCQAVFSPISNHRPQRRNGSLTAPVPFSHSIRWASAPPAWALAAEKARYANPSFSPHISLTLTSLARLLQSPETTRLLYDDPYRSQYGTNGQAPQRQIYQPDPETQRREREALEGICHSMSEYATYQRLMLNTLADTLSSELVDVFTILPRTDGGPANEVEKSRRDDSRPETPDTATGGSKPSPVSLKQYKIAEEETVPREVAYRSVRKLPQGHRTDALASGEENWEAAKAVMG